MTIFRMLMVSGLVAFAGVATAQDNASGDAATTEQAPAVDGNEPGPTGLEMGTPEGGETENAVGRTYVDATHGDWQKRCVRSEDGNDPCQMYQLLRDGGDNPVAEISIFELPEGQGQAIAGATIITPLETLLTAQLRIAVDGGQARRYPYSFCAQYAPEQYGCFARIGFTEPEIDQFKRGAKATVTIVPVASPNETVDLNLSLTGFTAAWNSLSAE